MSRTEKQVCTLTIGEKSWNLVLSTKTAWLNTLGDLGYHTQLTDTQVLGMLVIEGLKSQAAKGHFKNTDVPPSILQ